MINIDFFSITNLLVYFIIFTVGFNMFLINIFLKKKMEYITARIIYLYSISFVLSILFYFKISSYFLIFIIVSYFILISFSIIKHKWIEEQFQKVMFLLSQYKIINYKGYTFLEKNIESNITNEISNKEKEVNNLFFKIILKKNKYLIILNITLLLFLIIFTFFIF